MLLYIIINVFFILYIIIVSLYIMLRMLYNLSTEEKIQMKQIICCSTETNFLHRWGKQQMMEILKEILKSQNKEFVLTWDGFFVECLKKFSKTEFGIIFFRTSSLMPNVFARGEAINLWKCKQKKESEMAEKLTLAFQVQNLRLNPQCPQQSQAVTLDSKRKIRH